MRNILAVPVILVILGLSASRADIGQVQTFAFDAANSALQTGSAGVTQNMNFAVVGQAQKATDIYTRSTALQSQDAMFGQGAMAGTDGGGAVGVAQTADMFGGQSQDVAGTGPGVQDQVLNGDFGQETVNGSGIGAALGIQAGIAIQAQLIFTPSGASSNGQWLAVGNVVTVGAEP